MPRCARLDVPGGFYHLMARGNEKRAIFSDEDDYRNFIWRLRKVLRESGDKCLAWCLMPNHFHLLFIRGERPLPEFMRRLMTGHAVYFNQRHERVGHLFQNRYKSILCNRDPYLLELIAYIHLNPLRAGLVKKYDELAAFPWCGHREFVAGGPAVADVGMALGYFGDVGGQARRNYEDFMKLRVDQYSRGELSHGGSSSYADEEGDPRILGDAAFVEHVLGRPDHGSSPPSPSLGNILERVCAESMFTPAEIKGPSRARNVVEARAKLCFLAKEAGIGGDILSKELKRNSSAISYLSAKGRKLCNN